jgi:subtilisin family serine protease
VADVHRFETVPAFSATLTSARALDRLASRPGVAAVDLDVVGVEPLLTETVPFIGADQLHDGGLTGAGTTVAVFDSGIERTHPDLVGSVVHEACFDQFGNRYCPGSRFARRPVVGTGAAPDGWGHGTGAAGIVASRGVVTGPGVAPGADVVALKVYDDCPTPTDCAFAVSNVLAGLDHLVANPQLGVDVVNMSLGLPVDYTGDVCDDAASFLQTGAALVGNLAARGVLTVAAAGNEYRRDQISAPACISNVFSVGATGIDDVVEPYSDTGPGLDVLAPAVSVHPWINGGTRMMTGTSAAAPMVAGCALLLGQLPGSPGPDQIAQAMRSTGVPVVRDGATYPRLDCAAAARALGFEGGGGEEPAVCVQATNPTHVGAGRATAVWGYAFAFGSRDSLGRNVSTVTTALRQTGPTSWERVASC